jgi:predicted dehydrogenase
MNSTRRSLLARAGQMTAAGALAGNRILGANDRLRVALIGCGGRGRGVLQIFLNSGNVECVGLCDPDAGRLGAAEKQLQGMAQHPSVLNKDFRRIIDTKELDAVVIGSTDNWHALPMIMACQAGKDVYVEKPLSPSISEDAQMVTAARRYDRVVQAGTQYRSTPHFADAVEYVRSGKLGRVSFVRAFCYLDWAMLRLPAVPDSDAPAELDYHLWLGPAPKRPYNKNRSHFHFRWYWDYASGLLGDWGVHLLDIALWGMDAAPVASAVSVGGKFAFPDDARETPDTQSVLYSYPGFTLVWEHAMGRGLGPVPHRRPTGVAFHGTEAMLHVDADGWEVFPETTGSPVPTRTNPRVFKGPGVPYQPAVGDTTVRTTAT